MTERSTVSVREKIKTSLVSLGRRPADCESGRAPPSSRLPVPGPLRTIKNHSLRGGICRSQRSVSEAQSHTVQRMAVAKVEKCKRMERRIPEVDDRMGAAC